MQFVLNVLFSPFTLKKEEVTITGSMVDAKCVVLLDDHVRSIYSRICDDHLEIIITAYDRHDFTNCYLFDRQTNQCVRQVVSSFKSMTITVTIYPVIIFDRQWRFKSMFTKVFSPLKLMTITVPLCHSMPYDRQPRLKSMFTTSPSPLLFNDGHTSRTSSYCF